MIKSAFYKKEEEEAAGTTVDGISKFCPKKLEFPLRAPEISNFPWHSGVGAFIETRM